MYPRRRPCVINSQSRAIIVHKICNAKQFNFGGDSTEFDNQLRAGTVNNEFLVGGEPRPKYRVIAWISGQIGTITMVEL